MSDLTVMELLEQASIESHRQEIAAWVAQMPSEEKAFLLGMVNYLAKHPERLEQFKGVKV